MQCRAYQAALLHGIPEEKLRKEASEANAENEVNEVKEAKEWELRKV